MKQSIRERILGFVQQHYFAEALLVDQLGLTLRADIRATLETHYQVLTWGQQPTVELSTPVLRVAQASDPLPAEASRYRFDLTAETLFGKLDAHTLRTLDPYWLDQFYLRATQEDVQHWSNRVFTPSQTTLVVLEVLWGYSELWRSAEDAWRWLLGTLYLNEGLPEPLLREACQRSPWLKEVKFPLMAHLQEEWHRFLQHYPDLQQWNGVPFHLRGVAAYWNDFFVDGRLQPEVHPKPEPLPTYLQAGVRQHTIPEKLALYAEAHALPAIPGKNASYLEWFKVLPALSQFVMAAQVQELSSNVDYKSTLDHLENQYQAFLAASYSSLVPMGGEATMTHHVIHRLRRDVDHNKKTLLVVIDGLRFDQYAWCTTLQPFPDHIEHHLRPVLAWVPTLTTVARQAIFKGRPPSTFPDSLSTTGKEEQHYRQHLQDQLKVRFHKQGGVSLRTFLETVTQDQTPHQAVVINEVDNLTHHASGDLPRHHLEVVRVLHEYLMPYLQHKVEAGYVVHLTSDHGHRLAEKRATLNPKLKLYQGTDEQAKGERALILTQPSEFHLLLASEQEHLMAWKNVGLPAGMKVFLCDKDHHLGHTHRPTIAHGGCTLEETVVPYVRLEKR